MFLRKVSSIVLVGIAIMLTTATAGYAAPGHGGGFAGHAPSGRFEGHHGFGAHRAFDGRHFDGRHFDHRFHGGVVVAPFYWPYYPSVQSCPEAWVPVPG